MRTRIFTQNDQAGFASLSGDNNPVHLEEVTARRSMFGRPIVHGIHLLLCSLDGWFQQHPGPATIRLLKVHFVKPVGLNEPVQFDYSSEKMGRRVKVEVTANGAVAVKMIFEWDETRSNALIQVPSRYPGQRPPEDVPTDQLAAKKGRLDLCLETECFNGCFPHVARSVPPSVAATLLATTRLVGVECPGLHSIYAELSLSAAASHDQPVMTYEVTAFAERYGQVCMQVAGPELSGEVKALLRPQPQKQPAYVDCLAAVVAGGIDFSGQRAMVVGGSRGLGEITTKILCAGGANARLTYHLGLDDAQRVADEIRQHGGKVDVFGYDVLHPAGGNLEAACREWMPTHLYYFATPLINPSVKGFSSWLFEKFCGYYVTGFANTVNLLRPFGLKNIFYPSTVYLDQAPPNMVEYASAKAAGETLCAFYQKGFPELRFFVPRLPKMATDQTAGLPAAQNADTLSYMATILGDFQQLIVT